MQTLMESGWKSRKSRINQHLGFKVINFAQRKISKTGINIEIHKFAKFRKGSCKPLERLKSLYGREEKGTEWRRGFAISQLNVKAIKHILLLRLLVEKKFYFLISFFPSRVEFFLCSLMITYQPPARLTSGKTELN